MGLLDKIKAMLGGNADKVGDGLDKAGDMVDDKTGGKHTDKIDGAVDKAKDMLGGDEVASEETAEEATEG